MSVNKKNDKNVEKDDHHLRSKYRFFIQEPFFVVMVLMFFIILSYMILSLEHGMDKNEPHLKDEEGFYPWAELYTEGIYSIPIDDARGNYFDENRISINRLGTEISIDSEIGNYDGGKEKNDLFVTVIFSNNTPVVNADALVRISDQMVINGTTNSSGQIILYNLPRGNHLIKVMIPVQDGLPVILHDFVESKGDLGFYNIYSVVDYEILSQNTLNNSIIKLESKDKQPVVNVNVLFNRKFIGRSSNDGTLKLVNISDAWGNLRLDDQSKEPIMGAVVILNDEVIGTTNNNGVIQISTFDNILLNVEIKDSFNRPIKDVEIILDDSKKPIGYTGNDGKFSTEIALRMGEHVVISRKVVDGYEIPLASGIGLVNGDYHYINHWPPGPSVLLSGFITLGLDDVFGVFLMCLLIIGVYGIARRCFGWPAAVISSLTCMFNGVVLLLFWGQWMGDLAAVAFVVFGLFLFIEGVGLHNKLLGASVTFLAGIMFATAVSMRYSTLVFCMIPLIYYAHHLYININTNKDNNSHVSNKLKLYFSKANVKNTVILIIPFIAGLILIGTLIASYNATYYGGPFNSGYQSSRTLVTVSQTGNNNNISFETYAVQENFFEVYFEYSDDDLENIPHVMNFLFVFMPVLFLSIPVIFFTRKNPITSALLVWIILLFIIYLSQEWVLTRVVRDIRYYLPLVPPCSILFGYGSYWLIERGKQFRGSFKIVKRSIYYSIIGLVIALILSSSVLGAQDTLAPLLEKNDSTHGLPPPPRDMLVLDQVLVETNISGLLNDPLYYQGKIVRLGDVEIIEAINLDIYFIADSPVDKNEEFIVLNLNEIENPNLLLGTKLDVTGIFVRDNKDPDKWMMIVKDRVGLDIKNDARSGYGYGYEVDGLGQINSTRRNQAQPPTNQVNDQLDKPPKDGKRPNMPRGKLQFTKKEKLMWDLNLIAILLFYALLLFNGFVIIINRKRGEFDGLRRG